MSSAKATLVLWLLHMDASSVHVSRYRPGLRALGLWKVPVRISVRALDQAEVKPQVSGLSRSRGSFRSH